jgi:hypothetical protein
MSSTVPEPDDPTTEQILTALRTVGIAGGLLDLQTARTTPTVGEPKLAWSFWVKAKYINRDDGPAK